MLSANREDYIKKVFATNESKIKLTNKDLARLLGVSAASSSEMVKKLIATKHIEKDKELGLRLTSIGKEEARKLIRNHRLWEFFLVDKLGFSWADVHEEAELLEHVTSMMLGDRLNDFLGHPKYCPHGSPIYGNESGERKLISMDELSVGDTGTIRQIKEVPGILKYLEEKEVRINEDFKIIMIEPFDGPFILKMNSKEIILSKKAVSAVLIEEEDKK